MAQAAGRGDPYGWRQESRNLLRAVAGGSLFGMPLLYTMEMWRQAISYAASHLLVFLGAILFVNFVFSLFTGFRRHATPIDSLSEAVTSVGIALVLSAAVLWLIGELQLGLGYAAIIAKVLFTSFAVSVGISFVGARFGSETREGDESGGEGGSGAGGGPGRKGEPGRSLPREEAERLQLRADLKDAAATLAGATVFAFNVAPTEEIVLIAAQLPLWRQILLLAAEVFLCHVILFASGFWKRRVYVADDVFQHAAAETAMTCALSLLVALALLYLVGFPGTTGRLSTTVASTITLGLPAVVGGAAGRLAA